MSRSRIVYLRVCALLSFALAVGCGEEVATAPDSLAPQLAKGGAGPRIDAADPSWGKQGEQGKDVTILGSGFQPGDRASWERNGAPDPKVTVRSTQFVSSGELRATLDIAVDATIAFYDIAIYGGSGRKGGIGTEKFEVTTATPLPTLGGPQATTVAWGVNDAGQIVGRSGTQAFFWSPGGGIEDLGTGQALDLDGAGQRVVGMLGDVATLWSGGSGGWTSLSLPTGCVGGSTGGGRAITTDGGTAVGNVGGRPVIWNLTEGACVALPLTAPYDGSGSAVDMSDNGVVVGQGISARGLNRAMVWVVGAPTLLPIPVGATESIAHGVDDAGTTVAGVVVGVGAALWLRTPTGWSPPLMLPSGTCKGKGAGSWARDVSNDGLAAGRGCDGRAWSWQVSGAIVTTYGPLPGFGQKESGNVEAVNNVTTYGVPSMVGGAKSSGVYWFRW